MKSQKGVTIISLTIYIIVMTIVFATVALITNFFYKNTTDTDVKLDPITEYTAFNSFFSDEVNHEGIEVVECGQNDGQNYIVFSNGVQYTFVLANHAIYKDKVKICRDIENCTFSEQSNGKVQVSFVAKGESSPRTQTYTLKKSND